MQENNEHNEVSEQEAVTVEKTENGGKITVIGGSGAGRASVMKALAAMTLSEPVEEPKFTGRLATGSSKIYEKKDNLGLNRQERRKLQLEAYRREKKRQKRLKNNVMTPEKVLLVEFHEVAGGGKVTKFFNGPTEDSPVIHQVHGMKVYKIYDNEGKILTEYDHNSQETNLDCLLDKDGYFLCCVSKNEYGAFFWKCFQVGGFLEERKIVAIEGGRDCTEEECEILNALYPEYLSHAF